VLLDPLGGQPDCGESVAHGRRGRLVVGHGDFVHARTDGSGRVVSAIMKFPRLEGFAIT